jgi:DNA-binding response OmpR family regulator
VLVVEDDTTICEVVELALAEEGYDVRSVGNTSGALALLQEREAAVILLDLTLPDNGSAAFVATYRRLVNGSAPVLLVSGRADVEQQVAALGVDGWLAKPFDIDELVETVRSFVTRPSVALRDQAPDQGGRDSAGPTNVRDRRCLI